MEIDTRLKTTGKVLAIVGLAAMSGLIGSASTRQFGTSAYTLSYADFISILLTALGVMLTAVTMFVGILAVVGWNSIESRLREHSHQYLEGELEDGKPLRMAVERVIREAVYEGVRPDDDDQIDEELGEATQ